MGFQDSMQYILFTNPIATTAKSYVWNSTASLLGFAKPRSVELTMAPQIPLWKLARATGPYVRLAALSGAAAVAIGAYGSHKKYAEDMQHEQKVFETASKYHFVHTLALLGLPLCRKPFLAATFFMSGIALFCGTCYYSAFTGDKQFNRITPVGGFCFIFGWLIMCI
ncbi:transmembrane protein 256-like [Hylaeus volcanicus]|uniref:transmembrane protein 256-like n=1 Tax=Hylaeus volcanicus TaxID=313075 RepID=UPI0023B87D09|nr:transmembrane protein 256-like [Hylaeus volcanicus]XP_053984514.1 transmembrane protein 256-like [Hylaeus volcanicus]XP_053984515.1 transmembrane protein 256-like [Hylaeus volcanicus]XP_053984516.1 transmembrane protein 256-like [Hylaeus volcanicus]XP_053984517.1 transmembrane protein 256-like [Hylaeus volcanicus]